MGQLVGFYARIGALLPVRTYRSHDGRLWHVRELPPMPQVGIPRTLVFETDYVARRVRDVPDNWASLSPAELEALSLRR